ncbi:Zinc finger protein HD1 [Platanthera zijinensis]|uniref:Zinc finger protein HD1 n=1 Tax=Platanthera zijinensis TaxID=2320716 RepID=A0AAP0FTJ0_9ASPA
MEIQSCDFGRLICEICEQALATVSCKADAAVLCSECDLDVHSANPLAFRHERLPISSSFTAAAPDRRWKSTSSESAVATDREARVMRYREKRKNRRFGRTIRYASRKACAEARPRIKGRFAKRRDSKVEFGQISSTCFDQFFGFDNWTGH